jgi:hypothetical protein
VTPEATPSLDTTAIPTPPIPTEDLTDRTDGSGVQPTDDGATGPTPVPTDDPTSGATASDASVGMRVTDRGPSNGLLDTIVGGVAGFFFGG